MTESRTDAYGYNDRNELVSATKNTEDTEYQYSYDDIGNRLSSLDLGTNRTYEANNLNQYTSISNAVGETFSPIFDLDGNQTLVRTATGDWTVSYNAENRPVSWTCGATNIVMLFDRMGRRVEYVETVTDGSGESPVTTTNRHHRFVYDGYLCVQRLNARSGNAIELSFAWDPTEPVATRPLVLQRQGGWNFFYTHDGNKNVSDVVSFQQARGVPAHYEYAPFGAVTAATTNTAFTAFNVAETNPYRFSSEYADDTLGLVYYNYRHYNPMDGRWTSRDPYSRFSIRNLLLYCINQIAIDWLGLFDFNDFGGVAPHDEEHSAKTSWRITYSSGQTITELVGEYNGTACKDAKADNNGASKKDCPCEKCYIYRARSPEFRFIVTLDRGNSWVKDIFKDDPDLLTHENLHLTIAQKEAEKRDADVRKIWKEGGLHCSANDAKNDAITELLKYFNDTLIDDVVKSIATVSNAYDEDTEHGTILSEQEEWNEKYR